MPARFHRTMRVLTLLACVWFALHGTLAALDVGGSDFTIWYDAGRAVIEGRDPYLVHGFIYLPFFALCMTPISLLPYAAAVVLWQVGSFAALVWILRTLVHLVRADGLPTPAWIEWAPLLCVLRLVDSNFGNGQVNLLLFVLVLLGVRAWIGRREHAAGAWIGLAAALKILPGFLGLAFAVRRGWRACAILLATALACVFLVPAIAPGWGTNLEWIRGWFVQEPQPYLQGGEKLLERRNYLPGQSLTAVLYRMITPMPATSLGNAGPRVNVLDFEADDAKWVVRGVQILFLLVLVATLMRSRRIGGPGARLREVSLVLCGALTLAPLVHKAHMVWLIVPFALVLSGAPAGMSRGWVRARWTLIAAAVAFIGLTTPAILGRTIATSFLAHNTIFVGMQCLFAALLVDAWSARRQAPADARTNAPGSVLRT